MLSLSELLIVTPGRGVGPVLFGLYPAEVKELLGEPEQVALPEEPDYTLSWFFDVGKVALHFCGDLGWRLSDIETQCEDLTIRGHRVIGIPWKQALESLGDVGIGPFHDEGDGCLACPSCDLYLWVEDDLIASVQLGVLLDGDSQEVWPRSLKGFE